jgi:cobalt-zinc-cadmium efflux system membrane fusion protein
MTRRLIVAALLAALAACSEKPEAPRASPVTVDGDRIVLSEPDKADFLKLATVEPDTGGHLRLPGRLVWNEERTARIVPQVPGRIRAITADTGATVKSGQPLAALVSPDYGEARADAHKAATDLRVAQQALARNRELRDAGIVAEKDWQQAEAEVARAAAEVARAARRLDGLGGDGDGSYWLKSPLAGVVVERNLSPGMEYRPEQSLPPLFVVTDPTSLWIQIEAGEADVAHLRPGEPLNVDVKHFPGERFAGVIRHVSDFVDPQTRTVRVRGEVPNPGRRLKGEMFVHAVVELPPTDVLRVPAAAVFLQGRQRFVFVAEGQGRYRRQPVDADNEHDGVLDVRKGLRMGDAVVVEGNLDLLKYFKPVAGTAR